MGAFDRAGLGAAAPSIAISDLRMRLRTLPAGASVTLTVEVGDDPR